MGGDKNMNSVLLQPLYKVIKFSPRNMMTGLIAIFAQFPPTTWTSSPNQNRRRGPKHVESVLYGSDTLYAPSQEQPRDEWLK